MLTLHRQSIAALSQQAQTRWRQHVASICKVTVLAMIRRCREDSEEQYRSRYKVDQWEVPIVELAYIMDTVESQH